MSLLVQEMRCCECAEYEDYHEDTHLECKIGKNGCVYFQVHCDKHGGYSHTLERNEINRAVEAALKEAPRQRSIKAKNG